MYVGPFALDPGDSSLGPCESEASTCLPFLDDHWTRHHLGPGAVTPVPARLDTSADARVDEGPAPLAQPHLQPGRAQPSPGGRRTLRRPASGRESRRGRGSHPWPSPVGAAWVRTGPTRGWGHPGRLGRQDGPRFAPSAARRRTTGSGHLRSRLARSAAGSRDRQCPHADVNGSQGARRNLPRSASTGARRQALLRGR
ncbi:MAG: hypothetical protein ACJAQ3_003137 [Planctomycetota bacterium]|jgi:hypothetical protein